MLFLLPEWFHPLIILVTYYMLKTSKSTCHTCSMSDFTVYPTIQQCQLDFPQSYQTVFLWLIFSCFIPFTLLMSKCSLTLVWVLQEADATLKLKVQELYWKIHPWKKEGTDLGRGPYRPQCRSDIVKKRGWKKNWIGRTSYCSAVMEVLARPMVLEQK